MAGKVTVVAATANGTSIYSKLFFIPITLTSSALELTTLQVKYLEVSDTDLDQISVENPSALIFQRGKILNEGSEKEPNI